MKFTFAISCIAALSVAQVSDEVIEAWKAQNEAWEYMLEAQQEMQDAEYFWTKAIFTQMDNMAHEIAELNAYKKNSEYQINELQQNINNVWNRYEE